MFLSSGKNYVTEQELLCFCNNTPFPKSGLFEPFILEVLQGKGLYTVLSILANKIQIDFGLLCFFQ